MKKLLSEQRSLVKKDIHLEIEETVVDAEISIEVLETVEMAEDAEISIEVLEEEMIPMMGIGIVQSAIIQISQDVLNVIDVASHVLEAEAAEMVAEEISTEVQETVETAEDVETVVEEISIEVQETVEMVVYAEISTEALEIEETVEVEESEENSLTAMIIEKSRKKIIFASQRVKEQVMPTTMHQNL